MTSMYDSRRERVTLLCDNAMMNAVVDAFGEDVETKAFGDDAFTVETETAASPVFTAGCSATVGKSESRSRKT